MPHCHGVSSIPYPTLVANVSKGYVIRLVFDYDEARAMDRAKLNIVEDEMVGKVRQRVVCGAISFKESCSYFFTASIFFLNAAANESRLSSSHSFFRLAYVEVSPMQVA